MNLTEKKSWGPLNGRHLVTVFALLCTTAILIPATAWGVAAAKPFFIQDNVGGARVMGAG